MTHIHCLGLQTTTINCLTGVIPASGGDALVYGEALSSTGGMDRIRSMMGVCPQFDVLWSELTGVEHLTIYGNIKVNSHSLHLRVTTMFCTAGNVDVYKHCLVAHAMSLAGCFGHLRSLLHHSLTLPLPLPLPLSRKQARPSKLGLF